jgi:hypothetical protein
MTVNHAAAVYAASRISSNQKVNVREDQVLWVSILIRIELILAIVDTVSIVVAYSQ